MVPRPREIKVKAARKRLIAAAALALAASGSALCLQRRRIGVELCSARLNRLGDERSVVELRELARGSDRALEALVAGLGHPSPGTRALVACALAEFPRASDALRRASADADELVGSQARFALRLMGEAP